MNDDQIIAKALNILENRMIDRGDAFRGAQEVKQYVTMKLAEHQREVFAVLLLNARLQLIEYKELFYGTVNKASVYPREVVRAALFANASHIILAHNHPSGLPEPSQADINITDVLADILKVVDVAVTDHIIVGGTRTTSFAERGLI